jgi:hypothetical protein
MPDEQYGCHTLFMSDTCILSLPMAVQARRIGAETINSSATHKHISGILSFS